MLETLLSAVAYLASPSYWAALTMGVFLAVAVGLLPGISSPTVMALAIPFIVFNIEDPVIGLVLLATITGANNTLDSIPAILLGYPGAATQVTFLEGHQLARRGLAARTLGAVYVVSAIGGLVGALALAITIPVIKPFILSFSFAEIAAMALFGVAMVAALSRGAVIKGLIAGLFGLLLSTIGTHLITATERFTFGELYLVEGLPLIAVTLGLFALPEVIDLTLTGRPVALPGGAEVSTKEVFIGAREGLKRWKMTIRQSLFGVFVGAVPGIGSAVIDWLSYAFGILFTKDKSQFGKGSLDGVLFAESAQNAKEGGQAVPTLAFGVPGGLAWALVLVGMLAYNIAPGPDMLSRHADITIMIVLSFALANLMVTMLGLVMTGQLAKVTLIPYPLIGAAIIPISFLSAFQSSQHWSAIAIVMIFASIGLAMKWFQWPRPPMLLGFILGPIIERNLQVALSIYGPIGVITRPVTIVLLLAAIGTSYFFVRFIGASSVDSPQTPDTNTPTGEATKITVWARENLFTLVLIVTTAAFLWKSLAYPQAARFMPFLLSISMIVLLLVQILITSFSGKSSEIMDIGMRSRAIEGAKHNALILAGLLALLLLLSMIIGLQYAAMVFAVLCAVSLTQSRRRWLWGFVTGSIVAAMTLGLLDRLMAVIWPEPIIWTWFRSTFL